MPYCRHVEGVEEDVLPAISKILLAIRLRRAVCHFEKLGSVCCK